MELSLPLLEQRHSWLSCSVLAGAEAPRRAGRECVIAQGFLLEIKMLGQAEGEEQLQPWGVHCAWQRISLVLTEEHLIPTGPKWSHKKS